MGAAWTYGGSSEAVTLSSAHDFVFGFDLTLILSF